MQETDAYKPGAGDDYSPLPGKLVVRYDDQTQSREQSFYNPAGKLALRTLAVLDRDGNVCSLRAFDGNEKEQPGSEFFVDAKTRIPATRQGKTGWEVDYDKMGNWTERRRWFSPAGGGARLLMKSARQTIRYR